MKNKQIFGFILILVWSFVLAYLCAVNMGKLDKISEALLLFIVVLPGVYGLIKITQIG